MSKFYHSKFQMFVAIWGWSNLSNFPDHVHSLSLYQWFSSTTYTVTLLHIRGLYDCVSMKKNSIFLQVGFLYASSYNKYLLKGQCIGIEVIQVLVNIIIVTSLHIIQHMFNASQRLIWQHGQPSMVQLRCNFTLASSVLSSAGI